MAAVRESDELLGLVRQRKQALAKYDRNRGVVRAMQHEERRVHPGDALVGAADDDVVAAVPASASPAAVPWISAMS